MDNSILARANEELHNPNSPYFIGQPTSAEIINRCMNGDGYNTHYFGANKRAFLAQPTRDTLEILNNSKAIHEKNILYKLAIGATATLAGLAVASRIPVLRIIPRTLAWALGKVVLGK